MAPDMATAVNSSRYHIPARKAVLSSLMGPDRDRGALRRTTVRFVTAVAVVLVSAFGPILAAAVFPGVAAAGTSDVSGAQACYQTSGPAPTLARTGCGLFVGLGASYHGTNTDLATIAPTLAQSPGTSQTLAASFVQSSAASLYDVPPACSNISIPATEVAESIYGEDTVNVCGYWVVGESGELDGQANGAFGIGDIVDWYEHPNLVGWLQPFTTSSYTYQCTNNLATCYVPRLELGGDGNLCNTALVNGTPETLWCTYQGVFQTDGTTVPSSQVNGGCTGGWASYGNPSWCETYEGGSQYVCTSGSGTTSCPTSVYLNIQTDGNVTVTGPPTMWAAMNTPNATCHETGGMFCIPVTDTSDSPYSTPATAAPCTNASGVAQPGNCEQIVWFYQTDQSGNSASTACANAVDTPAFLHNTLSEVPNAPPQCKTVLAPTGSLTDADLSLNIPPAGGALFAEAVVYEWTTTGSFAGSGGGYEFPVAWTWTGVVNIARSATTPPANAFDCWTGTTWATSCTAPAGTAIPVAETTSKLPLYFPSSAGVTVGTAPPPGGETSDYSDAPFANCAPGYTCGLQVATFDSAVSNQGLFGVFPVIDVNVEFTGVTVPYGICGLGVQVDGRDYNLYGDGASGIVYTVGVSDPNLTIPAEADVTAYILPSCSATGPTPLPDPFAPGGETAGPEPSIGPLTWYGQSAGVGFNGPQEGTWTIGGDSAGTPAPDGTMTLCANPSTVCQADVANSVPGTYTLDGFPIWVAGDNYYNGGFGAPEQTLTLTFTGTQTPTTTVVAGSPNPAEPGQTVTLTSTTTVSSSGMPVPAGSGTVTFSWPGGSCSSAAVNAAGDATCTTTSLPEGATTVTASYSGDSTYLPSSGQTVVVVETPPQPPQPPPQPTTSSSGPYPT
jgi:hypothetical protein